MARLDPRGQLRWRVSDRVTLLGDLTRQRQYAQSLRNPESVVGTIFPTDLFVGAGASGIPVARSDLAVLAVEVRPSAASRIGIEGYARDLEGLVLVAPREGEPFALDDYLVGRGSARGIALDASISSRRYGLLASYAWQRVRRAFGDSTYIPVYGSSHLLEGGVIVFPTPTLSIRLGVAGILGRHATAAYGDFDWESCTLIDRGCEFGGSPHHTGEALGGTPLPGYLRFDLGFRKHWHLPFGRRDGVLALYGTLTNLLDRANVLTYGRNATTGVLEPKFMRPRIPLLVGLDWRF